MYQPSEADIQRVMAETGMDYLQARRHLQQRHQIQEDLHRTPNPYPLGKSAYLA